jgi:glycine/D-amino acid oxidase-like deaminating enzyme
MSSAASQAIVVGAGIFGVMAARELRRRGWEVTLADPGPIPHPLAASTDISKVVRLGYGTDEAYTELMEEVLEIWREWNRGWSEPLYHETGILMLARSPMSPGQFEYESFRVLESRGKHPQRLGPTDLRRRFPAWLARNYADGFFHPEGGYAESGRVVERLAESARLEGVKLLPKCRFEGLLEAGGRVTGIVSREGERLAAERVVMAAGAWTPKLLPHLAGHLHPTAHPVFHFKPPSRRLYDSRLFPVFTADISRTGWYGFPLNRDGIVKIACHGPGRVMDPDSPRETTPEEEAPLRAFLEETFPTLAPLPVAERRLCFYCDTRDEHFWIDADPERPGLVVAAGDSGHAFKFAPVLGRMIADVVEGKPFPLRERFRWRTGSAVEKGQEESRWAG